MQMHVGGMSPRQAIVGACVADPAFREVIVLGFLTEYQKRSQSKLD